MILLLRVIWKYLGVCVRRCDVCVIDVFLGICHCIYEFVLVLACVYCSIIARVIDDIITEGNLKALRCVCLHMC